MGGDVMNAVQEMPGRQAPSTDRPILEMRDITKRLRRGDAPCPEVSFSVGAAR